MKAKKLIIIGIIALLYTSCDDTLKEDFYSGASIDLQISTESGFENLIAACYVSTKMWFGKEYGWDLTTVGTDLWTFAGDADDMRNLAMYSPNFNNSWPGRLGVVWSELYKAINTCNTALSYIPGADISDEKKVMREGEVRFLKALYNWILVETWGNVAFMNEPVTKPELEMIRSDVDVFYTQIFEDLDFAVNNLPEVVLAADYGRAYKYAALALRARAHLTWASEYMSGNSFDGRTYAAINGANHFQQAIDDAQEVIDNGGFSLYDNYSDVWKMENNASANVNTENIWAINYSQTEFAALNVDPIEYDNILENTDPKPYDEREGGNHGHLMFGMRWFAIGGTNTVLIKDDDQEGTATEPTRPFCRYMPTRFLIDLYDANVDQRFYGSFNHIFYANNPDSTAYPRWLPFETLADGTLENVPAEKIGSFVLRKGDTAFVMFKDQIIPTDQYYLKGTESNRWYLHKTGLYYFFDMSHMYAGDGSVNLNGTNERRAYFDLQKWYDRSRPHNGTNQDIVGSQRGQRDFIVFRLPEMYYIIAEASLGLNNAQQAYDVIQTLANKRAVSGDGAGLLQAYGVNSAADVDIDFILDDKAREMAGEQCRWFDLKRTGKTLERIREHNPDAASNIQEKHIVRPIPQTELDAIENKSDFTSGFGIY
jgi:hypothetical protein